MKDEFFTPRSSRLAVENSMIPDPRNPIAQLPIIPTKVLKVHRVDEAFDNRFRACARLLQALWRERHELPIGTFASKGAKRRIGSLIADGPAEEGRNFLSPAIAEVARLSVAYQEPGALVDRSRLFRNLLSSHPLTLNLFAPLCRNRELAVQILRAMVPQIAVKTVLDVRFEHSPGRQDATLTGDRTAFDVAFIYERNDGNRGLVGIEVKYSESGQEAGPAELSTCYATLARSSGLFKEPDHAALRVSPLEQLFREHLLAQSAVMRGDFAEANFVLIAPRHNHLVQRAASLYAAFLAEPGKSQVPFINIELEQVIEAFGWAGQEAHAVDLHKRYTNWQAVDDVVRAALKVDGKAWLPKPAKSKAIALIGQAA
jgi:hypothetical protein